MAFLSPASPPPGEPSQEYSLLKFHISFVYQQANSTETSIPLKYAVDSSPEGSASCPTAQEGGYLASPAKPLSVRWGCGPGRGHWEGCLACPR